MNCLQSQNSLINFRGTYLINQHSSHYIVFMALIDHCYIFVLIFEYTLFKNFMLDLYIWSLNKLSQKLFLTNIKMAKVFQNLEPHSLISSVSFFPPNWSLLRINIPGSLNWTWWFHVSHDTIWRMSDYMMKTMFSFVWTVSIILLSTLSIQRNGYSMCHILPQNN